MPFLDINELYIKSYLEYILFVTERDQFHKTMAHRALQEYEILAQVVYSTRSRLAAKCTAPIRNIQVLM